MKALYFLSNKNSEDGVEFSRIMKCFVETGYEINNSLGLDEGSDRAKVLIGLGRGIRESWRVDKSRLDILHVGYVK